MIKTKKAIYQQSLVVSSLATIVITVVSLVVLIFILTSASVRAEPTIVKRLTFSGFINGESVHDSGLVVTDVASGHATSTIWTIPNGPGGTA